MDKAGRNTREEIDKLIAENKNKLEKIINRLAGRLARNKSDITDLRQVGWKRCLYSARYYRSGNQTFAEYVYKYLERAMRRYRRREKKHEYTCSKDLLAPSGEQKILIRDIVETKLDPVSLKIVKMRFWGGLTIQQIKRETLLTESQIKWSLKLALQKLKCEFERVGITGYDYNKEEFARLEA